MEHGETDPNIHYKPGEGYTTLHHAAHGNRVEVVRLLMEHGETDPNIQKKFGYTALRVAASQKHVEDMRGNEVVRCCPTSSLLTVSAQCPFAIGKSGSESSFSLTGLRDLYRGDAGIYTCITRTRESRVIIYIRIPEARCVHSQKNRR